MKFESNKSELYIYCYLSSFILIIILFQLE